jgi:hypothetical protein
MAIGCITLPLVGMLADRFWPAQKVLAGLNFVHALMLFWAATTNNPDILFISLLMAMLDKIDRSIILSISRSIRCTR